MTKQPKHILVVNPNTSEAVTEAFVSAISEISPPHVTFKGVTGTFGARIVTVEAENTVAAYGSLELIANHVIGCDAVILAISFDSGLGAAQSILPLPVVGISHAALGAATQGDRRIGVIFFGEQSRALYEDLIKLYGITPVGCISIDIGSVTDYLTPQSKDHAVLQAIQTLVLSKAESVAILGAAIVGMAARLQAKTDVQLYDGLEALGKTLRQIDESSNLSASIQQPLESPENLSRPLTQLIEGKLIKRQKLNP